jgi:hypothetical protein
MKYWSKLHSEIRDGPAPECFVEQFAQVISNGISDIQAAYLSGCTYYLVNTMLTEATIEVGCDTTS